MSRGALALRLGHGPPYQEAELAEIQELRVVDGVGLGELALLPALRELVLVGGRLGSIADLGPLPRLTRLVLIATAVDRLDGVESLPALEALRLLAVPLEHAEPLAACPRLRVLEAQGVPWTERSWGQVLPRLACGIDGPPVHTLLPTTDDWWATHVGHSVDRLPGLWLPGSGEQGWLVRPGPGAEARAIPRSWLSAANARLGRAPAWEEIAAAGPPVDLAADWYHRRPEHVAFGLEVEARLGQLRVVTIRNALGRLRGRFPSVPFRGTPLVPEPTEAVPAWRLDLTVLTAPGPTEACALRLPPSPVPDEASNERRLLARREWWVLRPRPRPGGPGWVVGESLDGRFLLAVACEPGDDPAVLVSSSFGVGEDAAPPPDARWPAYPALSTLFDAITAVRLPDGTIIPAKEPV